MTDVTANPSPRSDAAPVVLRLSLDSPHQRRWTIAIRWILAVPLGFAAVGIYVAAFVWVVAAWIVALFTGRVSDGLQSKLLGVLQFQSRLTAYVFLLTDTWPGVHFAAKPDDPVVLEVDHVDLRRSAVFFRFLLAIPALIISSAIGAGVYPFLIVMWVVGLFRTQTPRTLHQLAALTLRYSIRTSAYWMLLTPTQPFRGFFGESVTGDEPAPRTIPESATPGSWPGTALAAAGPAGAPPASPWIVGRPVKVLLIIALILGASSQFANNRWNAHAYGWHGHVYFWRVSTQSDRTVVTEANNSSVTAINAFGKRVATCATLPCVTSSAAATAAQVGSDISGLENSYYANSAANVKYVEFLTVLATEHSILERMSQPTNTSGTERSLYAKLGAELRLQYPLVVSLARELG
ncbi:MAG: DUF4389 domain-containing protein [Acidimicrobiales bacterium]